MENEIAVRSYEVVNFEETAMSKDRIMNQLRIVNDVMTSVMRDGEHYGVIPGCGTKPSLLKPGAEKLSLTFRLAPRYEIIKNDLGSGHREYEITCNLYHIPTGQFVGSGVGACSTMEGKFRFRGGEKEGTGRPVPKEYWNYKKAGDNAKAQALIGGKGFMPGKIDGSWEICSIGEKIEHDNPADYYNTVLKMAKKRAHVDAILTATGASDIFTQDVEDMPEVIPQPVKTETKPDIKQPSEKNGSAEKNGKTEAKTISENQRKRFYAIYKGKGKTDEQVKAYLKEKYKVEHSKDILLADYEDLIKWAKTVEEGTPDQIDCPILKIKVGKIACENCKDDPANCTSYQVYLDSKR